MTRLASEALLGHAATRAAAPPIARVRSRRHLAHHTTYNMLYRVGGHFATAFGGASYDTHADARRTAPLVVALTKVAAMRVCVVRRRI